MPTQLSWKAKEATVGELAERAGVATSTLRFYEREGLISSRRTSGNQRRYSRDTLRRVAFIRASQRLGLPLAAIRDALALLPEGRTPTRDDWAAVSECWREDLNQRIALMEQLRDHLTDCIGCGCLSLTSCALVNPMDRLGEQGPGARQLAQPCGPDPARGEQSGSGCRGEEDSADRGSSAARKGADSCASQADSCVTQEDGSPGTDSGDRAVVAAGSDSGTV
ncbi:redox-sensitive transcriptional activator SoxR [Streptomyces spirodelae]|uniref:redox-sensitive transcriptional activator SoxR n=1 Tax=Streptomyces spirodelae TaxID=2812904 RepID=UPI001E3F6D08